MSQSVPDLRARPQRRGSGPSNPMQTSPSKVKFPRVTGSRKTPASDKKSRVKKTKSRLKVKDVYGSTSSSSNKFRMYGNKKIPKKKHILNARKRGKRSTRDIEDDTKQMSNMKYALDLD